MGAECELQSDEQRVVIAAMDEGMRAGGDGDRLIAFHPRGEHASCEDLHNQKWLDFNMRQKRYTKTRRPSHGAA